MIRKKISVLALLPAGAVFLVCAPAAAAEGSSAAVSAVEQAKRQMVAEDSRFQPLLSQIASRLWSFSETALREERSARLLETRLEEAGFTLERGVAGMPTAFVARYGQGRPVIGILAEYDALPGVGNEAYPGRRPRADGVTSGHGCGHNLFAAGSVAGAVALHRLMQEQGIAGTLKVFGTPAEETVVGKVYMAKSGVFDGLDAVLSWHPGTQTRVSNDPGRAMNNFKVEFFGQSAHASSDPWNGRSALDAVEMLDFGVNLMREHVKPTARIHYVISSGGEAPNVVPAYARVWYYVRDINRREVDRYYQWILKIVQGAALATRTSFQVHLITGVHEFMLNRPLQEALQRNLELVGPPVFGESEQQFARQLQKSLGVEETGYRETIEPLADHPQPPTGGSTDAAEVSYLVPTGGFRVTTAAYGVPWHSWATAACHGTAAGRVGALVAAKVIAATGLDLLTDQALREAARQFHERATGGKPYQSPIPRDQKPPLPPR